MSNTMTIKTNNVPRDVLFWDELTDAERAEFDYLDDMESQSDASFFRHRGTVYDLGEFSRTPTEKTMDGVFKDWDGYRADSYFSGLLVKYVQDNERVIVATYYC